MSYYNIPRPPVREYAGGSVGGILRKSSTSSSTNPNNGVYNNYASSTSSTTGLNAGEARQVDLLVFGYACKLFRDDDKARDIDQGKHMIPWMGDATLKIDRYDVRGALSELAPHEPPPGGYGNRLDYLSADEQRAEQLCEEERYLYLYNNEEDHILQQEEDLKRLKQDVEGGNYAQVDFQYGNDGDAGVMPHGPNREENNESPSGEEPEQAFSLPKGFDVPITIQLPDTMKQHAIIEKTARFIASQGMQMEILLKAKQSNNVQFEFLAINGTLNPYYKYILNAIKNDTYPAESAMPSPPHTEQSTANIRDITAGASAPTKPIITVPTIKYIPSANCAYTQLISKIKGVPLPAVIDGELANMPTSDSPTPTPAVAASANFTPVLLQYNNNTYVSADAEEGANSNSNSQINGNVVRTTEVELLSKSSALTLAQDYASDTESEAEDKKEEPVEPERMKTPPPPKFEPILNFPVPTETLKNIIDKTASYVIKNGRQFEETLRSKSVDRFTFLLYDNEHYPYYLYKVTGDPDAASKEQKQRKAAAVAAALMSKKKLLAAEKSISPVCFSIKSKDDSAATMLQPGLPREPSDDDEENTVKVANSNPPQTRTVPEHVQKAIQMVESQLMARNAQMAATVASRNASNALLTAPALLVVGASSNQPASSRFDNYGSSSANSLTKHLKHTKAEMERNALFEQQQQNRQKELRKAEEKVKDKLAKIAREKLGAAPVTKEKQLQLERKRKAMAFLTQIKGSPSATNSEKNSPSDPEKSNANASDSDASVHSIPITSYGPEDDGNLDEQENQRLIEIPTTHIAGATPSVTLSTLPSMPEKDETKPPKPTQTINVSEDDDVQLVGEIKPISRLSITKQHKDRKRQLRSRTRDSSEDAAKPKSSSKHAHKRKHRRRSRSTTESSEDDDDDSSSSSESSSSSSSSSSTTTTTSSSSTSDESTENEAVERSRSHRKHKSSTTSVKKAKKPKSSKSRKLEAIPSENKKKSRKRTHEEEYRLFKEEHKAHKERELKRELKRERARRHKREKERAEQIAYEREQIERSKKHSKHHSTSAAHADEAYQQKKRLQRAQHKAQIQLLAAAAKREQERERQREREHRERRKQRDRELERDRSNPPTDHYDTHAARKEKKRKRERER